MQDEPPESPPLNAGAALPVEPLPGSLPLPNIAATDPAPGEPPVNPAWANDLRKLYNAVVEEPLPNSLIDLLSQLDAED